MRMKMVKQTVARMIESLRLERTHPSDRTVGIGGGAQQKEIIKRLLHTDNGFTVYQVTQHNQRIKRAPPIFAA